PRLADVVDGADVGVIEPGGGAGLAVEPLQQLGPAGAEMGHLEGDGPLQYGVVGEVDGPHAALAEQLANAVTTDDLDRVAVVGAARRRGPVEAGGRPGAIGEGDRVVGRRVVAHGPSTGQKDAIEAARVIIAAGGPSVATPASRPGRA